MQNPVYYAALKLIGLNFLAYCLKCLWNIYYFIFITVVVLAGADIVFYFEGQDAHSDIRTFGDAIWWSVNYLTTAGSNAYIATTGGKVVGEALMTIGFAVYSILIASVVSFFIKEYAKVSPNDDLLAGIKDQLGLDEVMERLERIEKKLDGKSIIKNTYSFIITKFL